MVCFVLLTLITGVAYPLVVTAVARVAFPRQSGGSVIERDGKAIGSELIAQSFTDPKYFWPRPSAANYNGAGGSGSNLAPSNPALAEAINTRTAALKAADPDNALPVPIDLVTASASGLDPHISPAAAEYQVSRIAKARKMSASDVRDMVNQYVESRSLGVLGEHRVNVLLLNLALDERR